jgi:hypothetical protein
VIVIGVIEVGVIVITLVVMVVVVGPTGPFGTPSTTRLTVVAAAVRTGANLGEVVLGNQAQLRHEGRVVGMPVGEDIPQIRTVTHAVSLPQRKGTW